MIKLMAPTIKIVNKNKLKLKEESNEDEEEDRIFNQDVYLYYCKIIYSFFKQNEYRIDSWIELLSFINPENFHE